MVLRMVSVSLLVFGISAQAQQERMGGSFSEGFFSSPVKLPRPTVPPPVAAAQPVVKQAQAEQVYDVETPAPAAQAPASELQAHNPTLRPDNNVCPSPNPPQTSSELKVSVDQGTKRLTLTSPDFPNGLVVPITAGGGKKVPHPDTGVLPYYACTRAVSNKVVTATRAADFGNNSGCSADQIRARSTMHWGSSYASRTFTNDDGSGVVMPNAVWANDGGIFIHRAGDNYMGALGKSNGSGGCIRVPGWRKAPEDLVGQTWDKNAVSYKTVNVKGVQELQLEYSETIYKQMNKYGAMELNISEPPPQIIMDGQQQVDVCQLSMAEREAYAIAQTLHIPVEEARVLRRTRQGQAEVFDRIRMGMNQPSGQMQVGTERGFPNPFEFLFRRR